MGMALKKAIPIAEAARENVTTVMGELNNGEVMMDFARKYQELLASVREHKKKGSISFIMTVTPEPKGGEDAVAVDGDVKFSIPKKRYSSMFRFIDKNNMLVKDDPRQGSFADIDDSFKKQ